MRHPALRFEPAVTVTALSLNNLSQLPYLRLRLSPTPSSTSPVAIRAKWLEHGIGSHTAFHVAALAHLAYAVPPVLAVSVPHPSTSASPPKPPRRPPTTTSPPPAPSLWLFAPSPVLRRAKDLLTNDFVVVDHAVWTPASPAPVTRALILALRRAIASAMQPERALRLADHIIHPHANLAYSFNISLGHGPDPHILIRVAARHFHVRHVDHDDSAAALLPSQPPLPVFTAPLGLNGTLSPRPCAGDALSASVLSRWREAGLLPSQMADSTVVFLKLDDGVEVPFPRVYVLTAEPKHSPLIPKPILDDPDITDITAKKAWKNNLALWGSRKRPRSPIDTSSHQHDFQPLPAKPDLPLIQPPVSLDDSEQNFTNDAPTAQSINAALLSAQSKVGPDPVPDLHHPLIDPIPPPSFHDAPESLENDGNTTDQSRATISAQETRNPSSSAAALPNLNDLSRFASSNPAQSSLSLQGSGLRLETPRPGNSSNGIEPFLTVGSENQGSENQESENQESVAFDMTDFTAFDEDVAVLFDGMDDRLQGDSALLPTDDPGAISSSSQPDGLGKGASSRNDLGVGSSDSKTVLDERMDVDSNVQPAAGGTFKRECGLVSSELPADGPSRETIIQATLSALRRPLPKSRVGREMVHKQLTSFYEQDHMLRRSASLKASRSIGKRRPRLNALSQRVLVTKSVVWARQVPRSVHVRPQNEMTERTLPKQPSLSIAEQKFGEKLRSMYVPERHMKKFSVLRRKGVPFVPSLRDGYESDSSSSGSEDDENLSTRRSSLTVPRTRVGKGGLQSKSSTFSSALQLPDAKVKVSARSDANNKPGLCMEYDAVKIVDSVAVDCASVCMVLAAERASYGVSSTSTTESSAASASAGESNGSPPTTRDGDIKSILPSVPQVGGGRVMGSGVLPKSQVMGIGGAQPGRISKKERELLSMIALLEMQVYGHNELELFNPTDKAKQSNSLSNRSIDDRLSVAGRTEKVSPATMRRLLLGLTRSLEMSDTFKTWTQSFRESDKSCALPSIEGPLSVNAFLGESASVFPLIPPRICVGRDKEWIETTSDVLPLWEKTGLEPYGEPKNVEYVTLAPKELKEDVAIFLRDVSAAYQECSFGKHTAAPFESVTLVANSMGDGASNPKVQNGGSLSDSDKAMAEQYHLSTTTLCTKLAAVAREKRKKPSGSATNIVVYVVSPFEKNMNAANVALLQAVAPLVGNVPGTVPSLSGHSTAGLNLPAAPWRCSPVSKSVVSITVRIIPREVVDRRLIGQTDLKYLKSRPLRPQLIKAVCFAVFSSIRFKRVRTPSSDAEIGSVLARGSMVPDDLMSPMTPEVMGDGVGGPCGTPVSPIGVCSDDVGYNVNAAGGHVNGHVDQSWALSPSYLYEGAIALAGVGKHIEEGGRNGNMTLHLGYGFCESSSRYIFAWTNERGEVVDTASVPVSRSCVSASRRKAFWGMWARGQRWRLSYVQEVHVTVCKVGGMSADELEDWDWVVNKVVCGQSNGAERKGCGGSDGRVVRRFPRVQGGKNGDEIVDVYTDAPTPATPGMGQSGSSCNGSGNSNAGGKIGQMSMEIKLPGISSVSILNVCEADTDLLMEKAGDYEELDRRDFGIVSDVSLCKGMKAQSNVILGRFGDNGMSGVEIGILRHYGCVGEGEDMSDGRSRWDWFDIDSIANTIGKNFHELRYVGSPPSWPMQRWLSLYPIHLEAVRSIGQNLSIVNMFGGGGVGGVGGIGSGVGGGIGGPSSSVIGSGAVR